MMSRPREPTAGDIAVQLLESAAAADTPGTDDSFGGIGEQSGAAHRGALDTSRSPRSPASSFTRKTASASVPTASNYRC